MKAVVAAAEKTCRPCTLHSRASYTISGSRGRTPKSPRGHALAAAQRAQNGWSGALLQASMPVLTNLGARSRAWSDLKARVGVRRALADAMITEDQKSRNEPAP